MSATVAALYVDPAGVYANLEPPELRWGDGGMKAIKVNDAGSKANPHRRSRTPPAFRDVLLAMARSAAREPALVGRGGDSG